MLTASSQILSMDFDHKSAFPESSFDSSFNYMDSGLDYFQYPPSSSNLSVSIGLPQTGAPMDFASMNLMAQYTYSSSSGAPSPPRPYTPSEGGSVAPQTFGSYGLSAGKHSSDSMPSGRMSRGNGFPSPPAIPYSATIPCSAHRFNPIAVPNNRPIRVAAHKRTSSSRINGDSDDDGYEEFEPGSIAGSNDSPIPRDL